MHFDRGEYSRAVQFAEKAVRVAPSRAEFRMKLGDAYFKVLRYELARVAYQKALDLGAGAARERLKRLRDKLGG